MGIMTLTSRFGDDDMKSRSYRILNDLINSNNIRIDDLSYKYDVSNRTIRYDINNLNKYLEKFNLTIIKDSEMNIKIEGIKTRAFAKKILAQGKEELFFTPSERKYFILFKLFISYEPIIIDYLSNALNVSRNTTLKTVDAVEQWLNNNSIKLIRKTNYGIKIDGKEEKVREAFLKLIYENFQINELLDYLKNNGKKHRTSKLGIIDLSELFKEIQFNKIEEIVHFIQEEVGYKFTEKSYLDLNLYLAFSIIRLKNNKKITIGNKLLSKLDKTSEYIISERIFGITHELFNVPSTKSERAYLTLKILSSGVSSDVNSDNKFKNNLKSIVKEMINIVERELGIKLKDEELFKGLLLHLKPLLNRINYDNEVQNPLLDEIKNKYKKIYDATKKAVKIIEADYGKYVSEDEVAYIAMHFGAAFERRRRFFNKNKLNTVIVCPSGIGTSKLIASKLQHEFQELNIIDTLTIKDLKNNLELYKNFDLIISTVELSFVKDNLVVINPILTSFERKRIKEYIKNKSAQIKLDEEIRYSDYKFAIDEFYDAIKNDFILKNSEEEFKDKLINFFENKKIPVKYEFRKEVERETFGLLDLIEQDFIIKTDKVNDWIDSIHRIGNRLIENNRISKNYMDSTIEIIKEKGPYVVFAPGVALVHARPQDGVIEPTIGFLVLNEPVAYENNKSVNIVIMLAPKDRSSHIPAISDLLEIFGDGKSIDEFIQKKNNIEIYEYIRNILKGR